MTSKKFLNLISVAALLSVWTSGLACAAVTPRNNPSPNEQASEVPAATEQLAPAQSALIEILYMPMRMNFRVSDLPDFMTHEVMQPQISNVVTERIARDQRAYFYHWGTQSPAIIETYIIILKPGTGLTVPAMYDVVLAHERSNFSKQSETPITLGKQDQAILYQITADECNPGYGLVAMRGDVVSFVLGCGQIVTPDLMQQIGLKMDEHITDSAKSCAELGLTPQECANLGHHTYKVVSDKVEPIPGSSTESNCFPDSTTGMELVINFSEASFQYFSIDNEFQFSLPKTGVNTYSAGGEWGNGNSAKVEFKAVFTDDGFQMDTTNGDEDSLFPCHWSTIYQRTD
jgi:hypothetical protein